MVFREDYLKTWQRFCQEEGCKNTDPPTEAQFCSYFEKLTSRGYSESFARATFYHLNAVCHHYFQFKPLKKWPKVSKLLKELKADHGDRVMNKDKPVPKLYQVTWKKFLDEEKIKDASVMPSEEHFVSYFERMIQRGLSQTTIRYARSFCCSPADCIYNVTF